MKNYINLYDYFNYREFLADYYEARKARDKNFSYRYFAMKAGYNSSGLYSSIVQSKVSLTEKTTPKFIKALQLTEAEEKYFRLMVDFTHALTSKAKQEIFDEMLPFLPKKVQKLKSNQREYYSKWYHIAIHLCLDVVEIQHENKEELTELAKTLNPPISYKEAKSSLQLLKELDLVEVNDEGYLKSRYVSVMGGGDELGAMSIHQYQCHMMDMAKESLSRFNKADRQVRCTSMSVSEEGRERILNKIENFQKDIREIVRSDSEESQVYHFNVQFFPLSNSLKKAVDLDD